jgi:hypothetical protein
MHDELVFEVATEHVADVAAIVSAGMTSGGACAHDPTPVLRLAPPFSHATSSQQQLGLRVPFPVELSVGRSWGELRKISMAALRDMQLGA